MRSEIGLVFTIREHIMCREIMLSFTHAHAVSLALQTNTHLLRILLALAAIRYIKYTLNTQKY